MKRMILRLWRPLAAAMVAGLGLALVLPDASVQAATTHYVSKDGSGADGKSWGTAWKELDQINWNAVEPGDVIVLDGSSTKMVYTTTLLVGKSGMEPAPIRIQRATEAGHDGQVVIFGGRAAPLVCGHADRHVFQTEGVRKSGVDFGVCSHVVLDGMKWRGIAIYGHNLHGVHLSKGSSDDIVRNAEIYDNGMAVFNPTQKWWNSDHPGVGLSGTGHVFEQDIIHDNGQDAFQSGGGLGQLTIRRCWLYNGRPHPARPGLAFNYSMHSDGIQVYNGGAQSGILIEESVVGPGMMQGTILGQVTTAGPVARLDDVTIRNCLFINLTNANIMGYPQLKNRNWTIDHVTAFMTQTNPDGKVRTNLFLEGPGHTITDSIFYGSVLWLPDGAVSRGNIQFQLGGSRVGETLDPQFVGAPRYDSNPDLATLIRSDFALRPDSPAQGKGSSITSVAQLLGDPALIPLPASNDPDARFVREPEEGKKRERK